MLTYHQAKVYWSFGSPQEKKMVAIGHSHRLYLTNSISDLGFFNCKGDVFISAKYTEYPTLFWDVEQFGTKISNVDTWHRQEETIYGYCEESYKIHLGQ